MNRAEERRRRFNIFDLFVLALLAAVGFLAFTLIGGNRGLASSDTRVLVTYQVEIENVSARVRDAAVSGVSVRDGVRKTHLGSIVGVRYYNFYRMKGNAETGEVVKGIVDDRYNVVITCEAEGSLAGGRITVGDYVLAVGLPMSVQSSGISGSGYCISVETRPL
ncbi:MAG: DUF4330 family protein [Clostridiales bacterium]|nr:DUF4330 family protein [Clostridiales bacterium]